MKFCSFETTDDTLLSLSGLSTLAYGAQVRTSFLPSKLSLQPQTRAPPPKPPPTPKTPPPYKTPGEGKGAAGGPPPPTPSRG